MLPLASIERIVRKAGVERISKEALQEMKKLIEEIALQLAQESAVLAKHAGRKTIRVEDIRLAAEKS